MEIGNYDKEKTSYLDKVENNVIEKIPIKAELEVKQCRASMIPTHGPKEDKTYYYRLAIVAINYAKNFKKKIVLGRGWGKVPKNQTEIKTRVIERLLSMRKYSDI